MKTPTKKDFISLVNTTDGLCGVGLVNKWLCKKRKIDLVSNKELLLGQYDEFLANKICMFPMEFS